VPQPAGDGQVSGTSEEAADNIVSAQDAIPTAEPVEVPAEGAMGGSNTSQEGPVQNEVPAEEAVVTNTMSQETPAPPPAPLVYTGPKKIIIVDDDANFREIFSAKFGAAGFEVKTAVSGKALLEMLNKGEFMPDLVLMDINMPGEAGTDVAFAIKQDPKTENLHVAFLTNQKEPWPAIAGNREKVAKELGMEDFLEKGADLDDLIKKVNDILARISGQTSA